MTVISNYVYVKVKNCAQLITKFEWSEMFANRLGSKNTGHGIDQCDSSLCIQPQSQCIVETFFEGVFGMNKNRKHNFFPPQTAPCVAE